MQQLCLCQSEGEAPLKTGNKFLKQSAYGGDIRSCEKVQY